MSSVDYYHRLVRCLPRLMKNAAFAKEAKKWGKDLDRQAVGILDRARNSLPIDFDDEDLLVDLVRDSYWACAETILTLGWDGNHPGGAGGNYLKCCAGVYVIESSDWDPMGPYFSRQAALRDGFFDRPAANPELWSDHLPKRTLLALARTIVDWDNKGTIRINYEKYIVSGDKLVQAKKQKCE